MVVGGCLEQVHCALKVYIFVYIRTVSFFLFRCEILIHVFLLILSRIASNSTLEHGDTFQSRLTVVGLAAAVTVGVEEGQRNGEEARMEISQF